MKKPTLALIVLIPIMSASAGTSMQKKQAHFDSELCGMSQPIYYSNNFLILPGRSSKLEGVTWQSCRTRFLQTEYFKITNNANTCQYAATFVIRTPHMPSAKTSGPFKINHYTKQNSIITNPAIIPPEKSVVVYSTSDTGQELSIPPEDSKATRTVYLLDNQTLTTLKASNEGLKDFSCNSVMLRGVNLAPYKEGWNNDIDAVSTAVASTKANAARLMWWTHSDGSPEPQTGTTYYTAADLDRAIAAFANKGILPIVTLHDLTPRQGDQSNQPIRSDDPAQFKAIITAFWTRPEIVAVVKKHQAHLIINIANEWGPNWFTNQNNDTPLDIKNFIETYQTAITALRAQGINVPLMIDANHFADNEQIFTSNSYGQPVSNGQYLINTDPQHNLLFSVHTYYWQADTNAARLDSLINSKLPFVIGEMGNLLPDGSKATDYGSLLTTANDKRISYLFWSWYNDGTDTNLTPYRMNITINGNDHEGDGVTLPSSPSQNSWGWDAIHGAGYGIDVANPPTKRVEFK